MAKKLSELIRALEDDLESCPICKKYMVPKGAGHADDCELVVELKGLEYFEALREAWEKANDVDQEQVLRVMLDSEAELRERGPMHGPAIGPVALRIADAWKAAHELLRGGPA